MKDASSPPITLIFDLAFALLVRGVETPDQVSDVRSGRISIAKGRILSVLARQSDGSEEKSALRLKDLAEWTGFAPSTVSESVEELAALGLLTRERLLTDRRTVAIRITEKGRESTVVKGLAALWEEATKDLPESDLEAFWRVVKEVSGKLEKSTERFILKS